MKAIEIPLEQQAKLDVWYDALWRSSGNYVPSFGDPMYDTYVEGYALASCAWMECLAQNR